MRYTATYHAPLGETRIDLVSNTHTDGVPLLNRLFFRRTTIDLNAQSLPLAVAILTSDLCSEVFEFGNIKIANDYAAAIRHVLGPDVAISNVDGLNRNLSTGELDVIAGRAGEIGTIRPAGDLASSRVDWNGDFVSVDARSSASFSFGSVQTNALYFAGATRVSIAIGLMAGRDKIRTLYVPGRLDQELEVIGTALFMVGIELQLVDGERSS